ncbi:MAG: DUF559 domain-containing protein [Archangium sp.]|nr:DUF559 domain-containing protein [Archangium sp.]
MQRSEKAVMALAAAQHGVFSLDQARANGMSLDQAKRRVRAGRWRRVLPAVYAVEGSFESVAQRRKAAALWFGQGCVFSHRTAASLWGLARFQGDEGPVSIASTRHLEPPEGIRLFRVDALLARELGTVNGQRVTSVERTLLDLAATEPVATVEAALDDALRRKLTTVDKLTHFIERAGGTRGIRLLRRLTARRGGEGVTESELEARVLEVLRDAGMPMPELQKKVQVKGQRYRLDFRFPGTPVVLEADGYAWHSTAHAFEADRRRINALTARGFRVLQWTWEAMNERPEQLLDELAVLLVQRRAA